MKKGGGLLAIARRLFIDEPPASNPHVPLEAVQRISAGSYADEVGPRRETVTFDPYAIKAEDGWKVLCKNGLPDGRMETEVLGEKLALPAAVRKLRAKVDQIGSDHASADVQPPTLSPYSISLEDAELKLAPPKSGIQVKPGLQ